MQTLIIQLNTYSPYHYIRSLFDLISHILTLSNCHVCSNVMFNLWPVTQVNDSEPPGRLVSFDSVNLNLFRCLVF